MDFDQLVQAVRNLQRAFSTHRHTGLDSPRLRPFEQVEPIAELTAPNGSAVDDTYGAEEAVVINNTRVRVNEIEAALKQFGILK